MEKIRPRKLSETPEQPIYHGSEDAVLDKLHYCTDEGGPCTAEDAELLHKDFETCESYELYEAYIHKRVPSFTGMEKAIEGILARMPENLKDDPEAQRLAKLLQSRALIIRGYVRSYVQSIIKFRRQLKSSRNAIHDPTEYHDPEMDKKADHERRRKHENLLKGLTEMRKLFDDAYDYGILEKSDYREWLPGDHTEMPEGVVPLFSTQAIANRDLIKNWALAADFAENYKKLTDMLEQKK